MRWKWDPGPRPYSPFQENKEYQWSRLIKVWYYIFIYLIDIAAAAAKKVQRVQKKRVGQIHTKVHFYRPHTLRLSRKPKYERTAVAKENKMDVYAVIKKPVVTESAMKKIEVGTSNRVN